jgi:hypothetical protein
LPAPTMFDFFHLSNLAPRLTERTIRLSYT